ncbi:unnamed protein product [Phytomonas sp. EM1]|nr:unnamed protein product [Phytomonas sp. EM1]|eukprot:CCW61535.1 unnamed protein product [Phytomonas sp. isolate EM1]
MKLLCFLAILVFGVTLCSSPCLAHNTQGDGSIQSIDPFIFVSKTTSCNDLALGSSVEIVTTVYNYGQSPAFDVVITDMLENGTIKEKRVDSIPYNGSETLRYHIQPSKLGEYPVGLATVRYNLEQGDNTTSQTALSNLIREGDAYYMGEDVDDESFRGRLSVLTRERYDRLHARFIKETTAYIFLGCIPTIFPYVLYHVKQSMIVEILRRSKRSR